jgi:hypothetical protein
VLLLLAFCLVIGTTFATAMVGATFGFDLSTGQAENVDEASDELENSEDDLATGGSFNPVASLGVLADAFNVLGAGESSLVNLTVPPAVASFVTGPVGLLIGLAVIQIVIRQRL